MSQVLVFTPYILTDLVFLGRGIRVQNTMSEKHRDSCASPSAHTTFLASILLQGHLLGLMHLEHSINAQSPQFTGSFLLLCVLWEWMK